MLKIEKHLKKNLNDLNNRTFIVKSHAHYSYCAHNFASFDTFPIKNHNDEKKIEKAACSLLCTGEEKNYKSVFVYLKKKERFSSGGR